MYQNVCEILQTFFIINILFCSGKADMVPGYDFLVNSVWPEIARGLEEKLPSLFNPGNPDIFHQVFFTYNCLSKALKTIYEKDLKKITGVGTNKYMLYVLRETFYFLLICEQHSTLTTSCLITYLQLQPSPWYRVF